MAILTIARELGSICNGEELVLCNSLKLHCVNKAILEERFNELGIERKVLERFDECNPGFSSLFNSSSNVYWESLQAVLLKELLGDNVAIIGRGGNFLLKNIVDCFRIRLTAPIEYRVDQICKERSCSENEALKAIRQSDTAREKFCRFYYGADWHDPLAYDLVINTAEVSMEKIAEILPILMPPAVDGARKAQLECAVQEQLIRHALLAAWNYQTVTFDVKYSADGTVLLQGFVYTEDAAEFSEKIVRELPGVKEVKNELRVHYLDVGYPMI